MPRHDAVKALNIYKRAGQQVWSNPFLLKLICMSHDNMLYVYMYAGLI